MKYVLDSCVAFKWVVPELYSDKALRLRDDFHKGILELIAPDVFPVEIAHALTRAERQKRLTQTQGATALADVLSTQPQLVSYLPLLGRAYAISSSPRTGVYDCLDIALAERESREFITADDKLVKTLQPTFPFLLSLASLP